MNRFIKTFRFGMIMVATVSLALHPGSWFMMLDLENAY